MCFFPLSFSLFIFERTFYFLKTISTSIYFSIAVGAVVVVVRCVLHSAL